MKPGTRTALLVLAAVVFGVAGLYALASKLGGGDPSVGRRVGGATTDADTDRRRSHVGGEEDSQSWRVSGVVSFAEGDELPTATACVRGPSEWIECVETGEQHAFDLEVSGPGRYRVWASAEGFMASEETVWLSAPSPMVSVGLTVFPCGSTISGTVVDVAGGPISGALVMAKVGGLAVSDADGEFSMAVAPGFQSLVASHPEYASLDLAVSAPRHDVVLALSQASSVSGIVVDQDDQPVASAKVYASGELQTSVISGANGSFRVTGLSSGDRQLEAVTNDLWGVSKNFRLRLPDNLDGLEIRVAPTPSCSLRFLRDGEPLQGGSVKLIGPLGERIRATSDEDGLVLLGPLSEGDYEITAECESCIRLKTTKRMSCDATIPLQVEAGRTISGTVEDADGSALVGATVNLSDPSGEYEGAAGTSRGGGQFSIGGVWAGDIAVTAHHPAHWQNEEMTTSADEIVVRMSPGGIIRGRVVAPGEPSGAVVRVGAESSFGAKTIPVDADGRFVLNGLPLDGYKLEASFPGDARTSEPVHVSLSEGNADLGVELKLEAPERTLAGLVLVDGTPAGNAVIRVRQGIDETVASADENGAFTFTGLRAKRVKVFVTTSSGQAKFFGSIEVERGVILELEAETTVCGSVGGTDLDGGPIVVTGPSARRRLSPRDPDWCIDVPRGRSGELISARQGWRYGETTLKDGVEIQLEQADAVVEGVLEREDPGGIRVWFSRPGGLVYGYTTTADDGSFRGEDLPYATVVVSARIPGCSLKDCPNASVNTGPEPVEVRIFTDE